MVFARKAESSKVKKRPPRSAVQQALITRLLHSSKAPFMRTVPFCGFTAALLHIRKSAQHLDISRSTLWRMLK